MDWPTKWFGQITVKPIMKLIDQLNLFDRFLKHTMKLPASIIILIAALSLAEVTYYTT